MEIILSKPPNISHLRILGIYVTLMPIRMIISNPIVDVLFFWIILLVKKGGIFMILMHTNCFTLGMFIFLKINSHLRPPILPILLLEKICLSFLLIFSLDRLFFDDFLGLPSTTLSNGPSQITPTPHQS